MIQMSIAEMAQIMEGRANGDVELSNQAQFHFDSREVKAGDIFLALKGERADGHDYVADAISRGAVLSIVSRAVSIPHILVGDVLVGGASLLKAFEGGDVWIGDLLFVCASICWSAYSVTVRRFGLDAARATMAITAFAFVCFVPLFTLLVLLNILPSHFSQASWTEILLQVSFQGVGSVAISGISFTQMIRSYGPVKSTMITAVVPGLSALGAVIILGEPMSWNLMVGLALVTCGILFGVRQAMVKT